jgi:hypothetical protein
VCAVWLRAGPGAVALCSAWVVTVGWCPVVDCCVVLCEVYVSVCGGCWRGQVPPLALPSVDTSSFGAVATSLLSAAGVLADEVVAVMQSCTVGEGEGGGWVRVRMQAMLPRAENAHVVCMPCVLDRVVGVVAVAWLAAVVP